MGLHPVERPSSKPGRRQWASTKENLWVKLSHPLAAPMLVFCYRVVSHQGIYEVYARHIICREEYKQVLPLSPSDGALRWRVLSKQSLRGDFEVTEPTAEEITAERAALLPRWRQLVDTVWAKLNAGWAEFLTETETHRKASIKTVEHLANLEAYPMHEAAAFIENVAKPNLARLTISIRAVFTDKMRVPAQVLLNFGSAYALVQGEPLQEAAQLEALLKNNVAEKKLRVYGLFRTPALPEVVLAPVAPKVFIP